MKKIYLMLVLIISIFGLLLNQKNKELAFIIYLGMLLPVIVSFFNIIIIDYILEKYDYQKLNSFNIIQFIPKSIFLITLTYIGIKIFNFPHLIYISLLCSSWFIFHVLEAIYIQNYLKNQNNLKKNN
tara:strand:- start:10 stop:390 length:381 start_codon:yes stop_codon:yes gene_type:complete